MDCTIHEFLDYSPETGIFRWKKSPSQRAKVGAIAGHKHGQGYREIELRGRIYQAHRLAWFMVFGTLLKSEIDHINGVKDDNRICNLREATKSENQYNRKIWSKGTSSNLKGVCFHRLTGKWQANIQCNKKRTHLGLFATPEEAHQAYAEAAMRLHGEFARP